MVLDSNHEWTVTEQQRCSPMRRSRHMAASLLSFRNTSRQVKSCLWVPCLAPLCAVLYHCMLHCSMLQCKPAVPKVIEKGDAKVFLVQPRHK